MTERAERLRERVAKVFRGHRGPRKAYEGPDPSSYDFYATDRVLRAVVEELGVTRKMATDAAMYEEVACGTTEVADALSALLEATEDE